MARNYDKVLGMIENVPEKIECDLENYVSRIKHFRDRYQWKRQTKNICRIGGESVLLVYNLHKLSKSKHFIKEPGIDEGHFSLLSTTVNVNSYTAFQNKKHIKS